MAKSGAKARSTRKRVTKPSKRAAATRKREEKSFTRSLVAHGQAVVLPAGGKLPPGATHELVRDENGEVRVVRRRFSQF
jgi:hypothetical protein